MAAIWMVKGGCVSHCLSKSLINRNSYSLVSGVRLFSTEDDSRTPPQSIPIQPVSYNVKLMNEPNENAEKSASQQQEEQQRQRNWTREDIRYVKDTPSPISPVSYPVRVAPLPEDKVSADADPVEKQMDRERIKIEAGFSNRRVFRMVEQEQQQEKKKVPFPLLIKPRATQKRPLFDLMDAVKQIKANARKTFDETIEAHVRLGIEKSRSDLMVRGTVTLPHGSKKALRIAVFAEGAEAEEARAAGADVVGGIELIDEIANAGKIDFDKCFTTPQMYPRVAKIARILNRQGLMPDSKQGTVISNVSRAVQEAKKNQIKFKMDKTSIVHAGLGKVSLPEESLRENIGAFMNAILQAKPAGLKKTSKYAGYVNSFHICSTMGEGFPVSIQSVSKAVDQFHKVHLK